MTHSAAGWAGLFPHEMKEALQAMGEAGYRAKQIFGWFARGCSFAHMSNLPPALREKLVQVGASPAELIKTQTAKDAQTEKYLFKLEDGHIVEGVLLRYHHGNTLCLSTQVGCRMGCAFCASTIDGWVRNVTAGEMLFMAALINAKEATADRRGVGNVVLMGSGEPLDNYDEVVRFLQLLSHPEGLNISLRNVTLSTCGLVEGMDKLAKQGFALTLSVSLHAPNDEVRKLIMPIAHKYTLKETVAACVRYERATKRRITIDYTLISGLNDAPEQATQLTRLLKGLGCHVNLIPLNPVKERPEWKCPTPQAVRAFEKKLGELGVACAVRRTLGEDIEGACGQLRRRHVEDEAQ